MKAKVIFSAICAVIAPMFFSNVQASRTTFDNVVIEKSSRVSAHDYDTWSLSLKSHNEYTIYVFGDDDTDIDTWLYDENDNLIDKDVDETSCCILTVTPKWSGDFELKIKNYGDVYNAYTIYVVKN